MAVPATKSSSRPRFWRVSPLRLQLLAVVAISFFPLTLLVVRLANDERNATTLRERDAALRLLDVALAEHRDLMRAGSELLRHLPGMPDISGGDPVACSRSLREMLGTYASFTNAARITPDLRVDCSATLTGSLLDVSTSPAIALAASIGSPVQGWIRSSTTGEPQATIVEPVKDGEGRIRYFLAIEAELNWFAHLALAIPREPGAMAAIVDSSGFFVALQPDVENFAGARHESNETFRAMLGRDSGFVEGVGLDSIHRYYAFRHLPSDNSAPVLLTVGLPTEVLYADANRHLQTYLGLLALMLGLTLAMAWLAADLFVIRDVKALLGATERLADGDLSSRAPTPQSKGELSDLAQRFNHHFGDTFVLPEAVVPTRTTLAGRTREGRWQAWHTNVPVEGLTWRATIPAGQLDALERAEVWLASLHLPGAAAGQRVPAWLEAPHTAWMTQHLIFARPQFVEAASTPGAVPSAEAPLPVLTPPAVSVPLPTAPVPERETPR